MVDKVQVLAVRARSGAGGKIWRIKGFEFLKVGRN